MPTNPVCRYRQRLLMKLIDDPIHPACGLLTQGVAFRKDFSSPEAIAKRMESIPDSRRRDRQRSVFTLGLDSDFVIDAVRDYQNLLSEMEKSLVDGPWLGGDLYSLADAAATPYVNRLYMLDIAELFLASCPKVGDWFDRVRIRHSFNEAITSWYSEDDADRFLPAEPNSGKKIAEILRWSI